MIASPLKATSSLKHNMAIKELEKGCELTAVLQAHLGIVLNDGTDSPFGIVSEEMSRTLALSRDILRKPDRNLLGSKVVTSQVMGGARTNKRRRDDKFKGCQRRKYNHKRTELTSWPHLDGYQWRKYGQKNIQNQRYPRCYYRCTYYQDRKCMAAKQVQQYNDDCPPLFEVKYIDEHTCNIAISNTRSTINQNIVDFSGKSIPESNSSMNAMGCRRKDEETALVSCLTSVITGYSSRISENSNGGHQASNTSIESSVLIDENITGYNKRKSEKSIEFRGLKALNTSIESSVLIDDNISFMESTLLREDGFPVVNGTTMDLEWLEQDTHFLWEYLALI